MQGRAKGWRSKIGYCDRCGNNGNLVPSFGKWICIQCKDNRPKKMRGNSGMCESNQIPITFGKDLCLERVAKSHTTFGRLFFEHYPQSKGIPGRSFCYLIHNKGSVIGIIGFNSPPFGYRIFREFFRTEDDNMFMSNNVFRIVVRERNLGTRVLRLARRQIQQDHVKKWGFSLLGLVTFVEPPRTGALYKADNWTFLGLSEGIRVRRDKESWNKVYEPSNKKLIFGFKY